MMRKITNPEEFRANVSNKINVILKNEKNSRNLERGIYNYALKEASTRKVVKKWDNPYFTQIYINQLRSIYTNLNDASLLAQLESGIIKAQDIAFMTHQELRPDHWEKMIQDKIKRDKSKYETTIQASTDTFTCRKCRSKNCTFTSVQVRAADESSTLYINCLNCGKNWKE